MITVNDIKNGLTIKYNGTLYLVLEFQHVKPGKGSAFVRTKLRNLDNGSIQDITFSNTAEKIEKAHIDKKDMQYLYAEGDTFYFMDLETYDQIEVGRKSVDHQLKYLVENDTVQIVSNEGRIIDINVKEKIAFEVIEAEPGIKGDSKSGGDKIVKISTGYELRAPLFVEVGDKIVINTASGQYVSREK
ncbi:MAG: elongation factor P [Mycoplasmatales bacterium]